MFVTTYHLGDIFIIYDSKLLGQAVGIAREDLGSRF